MVQSHIVRAIQISQGRDRYIRDVCSVASRAKGYQALPLLNCSHRRAGGQPGNEANRRTLTFMYGGEVVKNT